MSQFSKGHYGHSPKTKNVCRWSLNHHRQTFINLLAYNQFKSWKAVSASSASQSHFPPNSTFV
jgi:hypothetical protein